MNLKLLTLALSASLILPVFTLPATAAEPAPSNKPLATVNGVELPQIYANFIRQGRMNRGGAPETLTDEAVRDAVIVAELLSQEALRKGLDKGPTIVAAMNFQKKELLSQAMIENFVRSNPLSEQTVKAEYDKAQSKAGDTEYRASHILVNTEQEAKNIISKLSLNKKLKFEDLAKKESKDTSASNGGDLGWTLPANLVPEFANTMVKLKKGEMTKTPVKTEFGWHVIRMNESRKLDFPSYDKLKNRLTNQMQQQQLRKYVQELRASAKIE
jgi:peptidyl-prolyl cis-trans isomerase C